MWLYPVSMSMTLQVSAQMSRHVSAGPSMVSKEINTSLPSSSSSSIVPGLRAMSDSENEVKRALVVMLTSATELN
jgi:hypothetical protein